MTALPPIPCGSCKLPMDAKAKKYADPVNPLCSKCLTKTFSKKALRHGIPDPARTSAELAGKLDSYAAEDAAYREQVRDDARAEFEDWRDGSTARSLVDRYRDPPTRPEEF